VSSWWWAKQWLQLWRICMNLTPLDDCGHYWVFVKREAEWTKYRCEHCGKEHLEL
jgi:hypothetical protein